jgi:hypothetical protein
MIKQKWLCRQLAPSLHTCSTYVQCLQGKCACLVNKKHSQTAQAMLMSPADISFAAK